MNKDRTDPICGMPDDVSGTPYGTSSTGWMDTHVTQLCMKKRKVMQPLPKNTRRILFVDNYNVHNETEALSAASFLIRTEARFLPPNGTYLVQSCDSFAMQKIKTAWARRRETYKMDMIQSGMQKDSGRLLMQEKSYFIRLVARCITDVFHRLDGKGVQFVHKTMIITGMAKHTNGFLEKSQLPPRLQAITDKHNSMFSAARSKQITSNYICSVFLILFLK